MVGPLRKAGSSGEVQRRRVDETRKLGESSPLDTAAAQRKAPLLRAATDDFRGDVAPEAHVNAREKMLIAAVAAATKGMDPHHPANARLAIQEATEAAYLKRKEQKHDLKPDSSNGPIREEEAPSEEVGVKGPYFNLSVWEYYRGTGHWSDGMCVGIESKHLLLQLLVPFLWPVRLYWTLRRAAPLRTGVLCCSCLFNQCSMVVLVMLVFGIPLLCAGVLYLVLSAVPSLSEYQTSIGRILVIASLAWIALQWSRVLLSVGEKYNVRDATKHPVAFVFKTCVCICPMNVRVGLHVDRTQGFREAKREVMTMVELTENMGRANPPLQAPEMLV